MRVLTRSRSEPAESPSEHHDYGHTVGSNLRVVGAAYGIASLSAFAAVVIVARYLGKAEFGRYTVALALVSVVSVVADLGISTYVAREGARNPEVLHDVAGRALGFRFISATAGMVVAVCVAAALRYDEQAFLAVVILMVGTALKSVSGVFYVVLQALEKLRQVSFVQIQVAVAVAAAMSVTAVLGGGVVAVTLAGSIASALYPIGVYRLMKAELGSGIRPRFEGLRRLAGLVAPFAAGGVLATGLTYVDSLMVHGFSGNAQTGLYGAAYRLPLGLEMLPSVYYTAVLRSITHVAKTDRPALNRMYSRSMLHLVALAVPAAVLGICQSHAILHVMYGSGYDAAATAFALLMASVVFTFAAWMMVTTGYALGEEKAWAKIVAVGLVVNVLANAAAIPLWGIEGAAAVNLITMAGIAVAGAVRLHRNGIRLDVSRVCLKPLIAGLTMAGVVLLIRHWPLAPVLVVGSLAYLGILLALGTFDRNDWIVARALLGRGEAVSRSGVAATTASDSGRSGP